MNNKEKIRLLKLDIEEFNREKTHWDIEILKTKKLIEKIKKGKIRELKNDIEWFIIEKTHFDIEILKTKKRIEKIKKGIFSGTFKTFYNYE